MKRLLAMLASIGAVSAAMAADPPARQIAFAQPQLAAKGLCDAVRANDVRRLHAILGPRSAVVIESGDATEDVAARARFAAACGERTRIESATPTRAELAVGVQEWRFPFPLVKGAAGWRFDSREGLREVLARRIGRNELAAMQAVLAYVDAQREYAAAPHDHRAAGTYAQRIASTNGQHDGLYWEPTRTDAVSPLGVSFMLADADAAPAGEAQPYHGYFFRVLRSQGAHAPGGAIDYVVQDRMMGGFALVAYPARYRIDGVKTFIVNHDGVVYSRDLGPTTTSAAHAMRGFDPDAAWRRESTAATAAPAIDEEHLKRLASERGCMMCHGEGSRAGSDASAPAPSFRQIARRYAGRADAETILTRSVIHGSRVEDRHWKGGAAFDRMLPNEVETTPDEARALVRWILGARE